MRGRREDTVRPQWLRFERRDAALWVARMARWERFNLPLFCAVLVGNSGAQVRLHHKKPAKSAAF
jgi:hypothetical protein